MPHELSEGSQGWAKFFESLKGLAVNDFAGSSFKSTVHSFSNTENKPSGYYYLDSYRLFYLLSYAIDTEAYDRAWASYKTKTNLFPKIKAYFDKPNNINAANASIAQHFKDLPAELQTAVKETYNTDTRRNFVKYEQTALSAFFCGSIPDLNLAMKLASKAKLSSHDKAKLSSHDIELLVVSVIFNGLLNPFFVAGGLIAGLGTTLLYFDNWLFGASTPTNMYILPEFNKGILSPKETNHFIVKALKYVLGTILRIILRSVLLGIDLLIPLVHGIGKLIELITYYPAQKILKWMQNNNYLGDDSGSVARVLVALAVGLVIPAIIITVCALTGGFPALAAILVPTGAKILAAVNFIAATAVASPAIFALATVGIMLAASTVVRDILQTFKYLSLRKADGSAPFAESLICKAGKSIYAAGASAGSTMHGWARFRRNSNATPSENSLHTANSSEISRESSTHSRNSSVDSTQIKADLYTPSDLGMGCSQ